MAHFKIVRARCHPELGDSRAKDLTSAGAFDVVGRVHDFSRTLREVGTLTFIAALQFPCICSVLTDNEVKRRQTSSTPHEK
jgi:hypothetical protein